LTVTGLNACVTSLSSDAGMKKSRKIATRGAGPLQIERPNNQGGQVLKMIRCHLSFQKMPKKANYE